MGGLLFVLGLLLLVAGAEGLVRGASRIASAAGISPLVIGLTVVAFGTSAPEMAVSTAATFRGEPDLALGNVVGSNIFNILLILGAAAVVAPLAVSRRLVRLEVPVMIAASALLLILALDGRIGRGDGALLLAGAAGYTLFLVAQGRRQGDPGRRPAAGPVATRDASPAGVWTPRGIGASVLLALAGLALLVVGSGWLVDGASAFARALGISELVIGLTVVAAGTSLPELATSVVAAMRGEREMAVGNAVGSNLFNILLIVGVTATVAPDGLAVADQALRFDLPVMIAVSVACLPVFFTGFRIARWEGILFLGYYAAYTLYIVLEATGHHALAPFRMAMVAFVLPLTALTLILTTRAGRR